jgi:hypothetical protein
LGTWARALADRADADLLYSAHVLVGEPASTSPEHALVPRRSKALSTAAISEKIVSFD